eukprot:Pgem_evm1s4049
MRVYTGGAENEIRSSLWEFLLGVYPWNSTYDERSEKQENNKLEYETISGIFEGILNNTLLSPFFNLNDTSNFALFFQSDVALPSDIVSLSTDLVTPLSSITFNNNNNSNSNTNSMLLTNIESALSPNNLAKSANGLFELATMVDNGVSNGVKIGVQNSRLLFKGNFSHFPTIILMKCLIDNKCFHDILPFRFWACLKKFCFDKLIPAISLIIEVLPCIAELRNATNSNATFPIERKELFKS